MPSDNMEVCKFISWIKTFGLAVLTLWLGAVPGNCAEEIKINPEQPVALKTFTLGNGETANLKVLIETPNGWTLVGKPLHKIKGPPATLWIRVDDTTDPSKFEFKVTNAGATTLSTTVEVRCVWRRNAVVAGGGPGGSGPGAGGPGGGGSSDVHGLATGIAYFFQGDKLVWQFVPSTIDYITKPIQWRVTYVDNNGQPVKVRYDKMCSVNVQPQTAAPNWKVAFGNNNGACVNGPGVNVPSWEGTVVSSMASTGKLQVTLTHQNTPTTKVSEQTLGFFVINHNIPEKVSDMAQVNIDFTVSPAILTNVKFTIKRQRNNFQNNIGTTTTVIKQVPPGNMNKWHIPAAYWYGDPDANELCYIFKAPYVIRYEVQCTLAGETYVGAGTRIMNVVLNAARSEAGVTIANGNFTTSQPVQDENEQWSATVTIPDNIIQVSCQPAIWMKSQYAPLAEAEEFYHCKQAEGKVPRDQGGCGDLYTRNAVEFYLEENTNYDGMVLFTNPDRNNLRAAIFEKTKEAREKAGLESDQLFVQRMCYREKKAKEEAKFKEAYTYACTYMVNQNCAEEPPNPNAPWK